jgi:diamine N-acetyltransferase
MNIEYILSRDASLIASMNKPVQELHYQLYPEYFKPFSYNDTFEYLKTQLEDENWFCFIVTVDGINAGYALVFIRDYQENPFRKKYRGIHIDQIAILPEYQSKGIGKQFMQKIEEFAKLKQATRIELTHWELNDKAKGFYEHLGFETNFRFVAKSIL